MKRIHEDFCVLERDEIILYCKYADKEKHSFLVYWNNSDDRWPIHINTNFHHFDEQGEGTMQICLSEGWGCPDRILCKTMEEFESLTINQLQEQAYGAFMDGR